MYDPLYNPLRDIGITIFAVLFCAWWWFVAKEATSKKYIILLGICWLTTGIAYIINKSFDMPTASSLVLDVLGISAIIGIVYFYIRALLSERKAKKKSADD
jgi:hypothetical protein